jgi:diguanylate cyclase (GGDEF)-like protein
MYNKFDIAKLINFTKTLKVLYVEDNTKSRESLLLLIGNFFDDIVIAKDGQEGLEKFNQEKFDLIISDIRMPVMNGIEMCKNIRENNHKYNIPIIITTAHNESDILLECIKLNIHGFLLKPINLKQLEKVIRNVCEKIYYQKKSLEYEQTLEQLVKDRTKELEIAKEKLTTMANKDPLTNLYNRRYFTDIASNIQELAKRNNEPLSALMIDIDRFKNINDTYGHDVGDDVIVNIANILLQHTRKSDIVVRFGGEEFVILLPNTNIDGAAKIAEKIRVNIENQTIKLDENSTIKTTVSIGVSQCSNSNSLNIENLIKRTDVALYEAKRSGKNKVVIYEKSI